MVSEERARHSGRALALILVVMCGWPVVPGSMAQEMDAPSRRSTRPYLGEDLLVQMTGHKVSAAAILPRRFDDAAFVHHHGAAGVKAATLGGLKGVGTSPMRMVRRLCLRCCTDGTAASRAWV